MLKGANINTQCNHVSKGIHFLMHLWLWSIFRAVLLNKWINHTLNCWGTLCCPRRRAKDRNPSDSIARNKTTLKPNSINIFWRSTEISLFKNLLWAGEFLQISYSLTFSSTWSHSYNQIGHPLYYKQSYLNEGLYEPVGLGSERVQASRKLYSGNPLQRTPLQWHFRIPISSS